MTEVYSLLILFLSSLLAYCSEFVDGYRQPINCYHCASHGYKALFSKFAHLDANFHPMNFGNFCDVPHLVHQTAKITGCEYSCVTIFETQFIGGIVNQDAPFTFIRGCAIDIFKHSESRPVEIDYLHRGETCVKIKLKQIFPDAVSDDTLDVCSCTSNGCNLHDEISAAPDKRAISGAVLSLALVVSSKLLFLYKF